MSSKKFWQWKDLVESAGQELVIDGVISDETWWGDEATPAQLREELAQHTGPLTVSINSPGGDVFAGVAMYNALRAYDGDVTIRVDGLAASIASVITMAGDKIIMSPGSMMMIHKPWTMAIGNADEIDKVKEALDKIESTMIPIYTARTGKSEEEIKTLLANETWFTPEEAVAEGFADEYIEAKKSLADTIDTQALAGIPQGQMAYSMSAIKDAVAPAIADMVAKIRAEKEEEVAEIDTETNGVENVSTTEQPTEVTVDETETTNEATVEETETVEADDTADKTEAEEVTESSAEEVNNSVVKETIKMSEIDKAAAAEVAPKAKAKHEVVAENQISKAEARKMVVNALAAKYSKDEAAFDAIAKDMKVKNVIDGTSGEPLFVEEILSRDIRGEYTNLGRVGELVNRIDIEGAETWKQLVETAGSGFQPVALGAVKPQDQPVWTPVTYEPFEWALIVAWLDGVQKRSPFAVYQQIVRYIAREYARLEDKIILTYAGGSVGGETRPATGLVPILTAASRLDTVASYDSEDVVPAIGEAYGEIESDGVITLVANRKTWAQLATGLDGMGRPIFTVVGEQVSAGALGSFNVVLSSVLADGDVVIGDYANYNLVTRGGLGTLFSREATLGTGENTLNLFTQDASALRADVDITGGPILNSSFFLLKFPAGS